MIRMNSKELMKTLDYIQDNYSWEYMIKNMIADEKERHIIFKYVDVCYDTREIDNVTPFHVWSITLRVNSKETITFREHKCNLDYIKQVLNKPYDELYNLAVQNTIFS